LLTIKALRGMRWNIFDVICASLILAFFIYSLPRVFIGNIGITNSYYPGIVCILWLYRFSAKARYISYISIILFLLFCTFIVLYINMAHKPASKPTYIFLLILSGSPLIFLSYNFTAILLCLLVSILAISIVLMRLVDNKTNYMQQIIKITFDNLA